MSIDRSVPELLAGHFAHLVAGDEAAIVAFVHEDFVQEWPRSGERVRGRQACLNIVRNYPGGPPRIQLGRITGEGDHWVVEAISRYPDGTDYHMVAILELRDGKLAQEVDYFGPTYPAPAWRQEWVEPIGA
jgi:ketosteroid isomerase-like protein